MARQIKKNNPWRQNLLNGMQLVKTHPVLGALYREASIFVDDNLKQLKSRGWFHISSGGTIFLHPNYRATEPEWARIVALCLLNLGFGHVVKKEPYDLWELCALLVTDRFCDELNIGKLPEELLYTPSAIPTGGTEALFKNFVADGYPPELLHWYKKLAGDGRLFDDTEIPKNAYNYKDWKTLLALGIVQGVDRALAVVGNHTDEKGDAIPRTAAQKARQWVMDNYPLLGAMAAGFELVEELQTCQTYDISIAAINVAAKTILINPTVKLNKDELHFIFAHELLHAGLNHMSRRRGRDALLWNVACDFVINAWLIEMGVGTPPSLGLLYDEKYDNYSAEEVYDDLATQMRYARKLTPLSGRVAVPDMLGDELGAAFTSSEEYCRRALMQGLERCLYGSKTRGTIPAGLIEEIRSLNQPPIPWDVKLAQWFDEQFPPLELRRTYARPSRRQAATPNIPRPSVARPSEESRASRVFGVVLDTSGSMGMKELGEALGAIASYALARDVEHVRLICCDAKAYDLGWVNPEQLLHKFTIHGRGGTILQPGLDLLINAAKQGDFPAQGPVLIITDGYCENYLSLSMVHAYLLPAGNRLPFSPRGEVFYIS